MQEANLRIVNRLGLHARAAALFVKLANKYESSIRVLKNDQEVDGKSIMGLLTLAAEQGSYIKIITEGRDEKELVENLSTLIQNKFNEG